MMFYICGIIGIVGVVLIFVIYRYEKSITATFVAFDALDESNERSKCTREFWEILMQMLENYAELKDINVTVVVFYHKIGKKESLHFARLEDDWEKKIRERMLGLFTRGWRNAWVEIIGYPPDNTPDVAIGAVPGDVSDGVTDGVSNDALDSVPDGILDGTIGGVLDSTTNGVSKVIPRRTFFECLGDLGPNIELDSVVGFDGFI